MNTSENPNKITAVIPFYNEERHIGKVVEEVLKYVDKLILVNDGSSDRSEKKILLNEKIILLKHNKNLGKGAALKTGFKKSYELKSSITILLDADMQHAPEYISKFIEAISDYDCVIGSRDKNHIKMPIQRKLSNFLTSKLLSLKTGIDILDSQSGYRAFKTGILNEILPDYTGFEAESEIVVKLAKNNYKIGFIKIPTIYGNDDSKMKAIPAILGFIKVLLRT